MVTAVIAGLALLIHSSNITTSFTRDIRSRVTTIEHSGLRVDLPADQSAEAHLLVMGSDLDSEDLRETRMVRKQGFEWNALGPEGQVLFRRRRGSQGGLVTALGTSTPVHWNGLCITPSLAGWRQDASYEFGAPGSGVSIRLAVRAERVAVIGPDGREAGAKTLRKWQTLLDFLDSIQAGSLSRQLVRALGENGREQLRQIYVTRSEIGNPSAACDLTLPTGGGDLRPASWIRAKLSDGTTLSGGLFRPAPFASLAGRLEADGTVLTFGGVSGAPNSINVLYERPERWALPPREFGANPWFLLAVGSSRDVAQLSLSQEGDTPQYIFKIGRPDLLKVTKARVSANGDSIQVTQEGGGEIRRGVNDRFALFNLPVSPLISLRDPVVLQSPAALYGALYIVVVGLFLSLWLFRIWPVNKAGDSLGPQTATTISLLIWHSVTGILVTRAILSFRASAGPPEVMRKWALGEFEGAWSNAFWTMLILVTLASLAVAYVALRESAAHLSRAKDLRNSILGALQWNNVARPSKALLVYGGLGIVVAACASLVGVAPFGLSGLGHPTALAAGFVFMSAGLVWKLLGPDGFRSFLVSLPVGAGASICLLLLLNRQNVPLGPFEFLAKSQSILLVVLLLVIGLLLATWQEASSPMAAPGFKIWSLEVLIYPAGLLGVAWFAAKAAGFAFAGLIGILAVLMGLAAGLLFVVRLFFSDRLPVKLKSVWPDPLAFYGWRSLAALSILMFAADFGSGIYILPLILALAVTSIPMMDKRPMQLAALGVVLLTCIALAVAPTGLGQGFFGKLALDGLVPSANVAGRLVAGDDGTRSAFFSDETPEGWSDAEISKVLEADQQRWQMLSYVGAPERGFMTAPLSSGGISEHTLLLSDAAFSAFLISEHGIGAGILVVLLALCAGGAMIWGAWETCSHGLIRTRGVGLYVVGALICFVAVYIALSNLWLVPFNGQNFPLLGLSSAADAVLFGGLVLVGLLLLAADPLGEEQGVPGFSRSSVKWVTVSWCVPPALFLIWTGILAVSGLSIPRGKDANALGNQAYNLPKEFIGKLDAAASEFNLSSVEEPFKANAVADFFLRRARSYDSGTPLRFLSNGRLRSVPAATRIRPVYFSRQLDSGWRGRLHLTNVKAENRTSVMVSGVGLVPMSVSSRKLDLTAGVIQGSPSEPVGVINLEVLTANGSRQLAGGIRLTKSGLRASLTPSDLPEGHFIKVGGIVLRGPVEDAPVEAFSSVAIVRREGRNEVVLLSVTPVGETTTVASDIAWQNGRYVRIFPYGSDFSLAAAISEAYEAAYAGKDFGDITLTVRHDLHLPLRSRLEVWNRKRKRTIYTHQFLGEKAVAFSSFSLIDSFSGQILALPSFPQGDPNMTRQEAEDVLQGSEEARLTTWKGNWNFAQSTVGSLIKPWTLSSMGEVMQAKGLNLADIRFDERETFGNGGFFSRIGNYDLPSPVQSDEQETGQALPRSFEFSSAYFLEWSRTMPQVLLGFLGLAPIEGSPKAMLIDGGRGDEKPIRWQGQRYSLDAMGRISKISGTDPVSGMPARAPAVLQPLDLHNSYFLNAVGRVGEPFVYRTFDQKRRRAVESKQETEFRRKYLLKSDVIGETEFLRRYLPKVDLTDETLALVPNRLLPDFHRQEATELKDPQEFVRYSLGTGTQQWCTLIQAINFARITTGTMVSPTLSKDPADAAPRRPFGPSRAWREKHLLKPLGEIKTLMDSRGRRVDLASLGSWVGDGEGRTVRPGWRIVAKTGTAGTGSDLNALKFESELVSFTYGWYGPSGWTPGRTVTGALNLRSARLSKKAVETTGVPDGVPQRGILLLDIVRILRERIR